MKGLLGNALGLARSPLALAAVVCAVVASLFASGTHHAAAAFPGVNGKIAFMSNRDGNREIYVMNADGSTQTRLTNNSAEDMQPAWSPDGQKIAFVSDRDGNHEIYVMNADGSGQTKVTNNSADDLQPAWSPDGKKIAIVSDRSGNSEVWVMNVDGSGPVDVTNSPTNDSQPDWSPDGQEIAFISDREGYFEIYAMGRDGSSVTRLTTSVGLEEGPSWSPDGQQIAFESARDGNREIYVMNADGSSQTRLTNDLAGDLLPAWSPDGLKIAFVSGRDGNNEIYAMNADGSGQTRLTNNPAEEYYPDWGPSPALVFSGGGSTVGVFPNGNVVRFESPAKDDHIAAEGYVLCYTGASGAVRGFDVGGFDHVFGASTVNLLDKSITRSTNGPSGDGGATTLTQQFAFSAANRQLKITITVKNNTGATLTGVLLRRQVDLDVDGSPLNDFSTDGFARVTAWNTPDEGDSHSMALRALKSNATARVTDDPADSSCTAATARDPSTTQDNVDDGATLTYDLGNLGSGKSKTVQLSLDR